MLREIKLLYEAQSNKMNCDELALENRKINLESIFPFSFNISLTPWAVLIRKIQVSQYGIDDQFQYPGFSR